MRRARRGLARRVGERPGARAALLGDVGNSELGALELRDMASFEEVRRASAHQGDWREIRRALGLPGEVRRAHALVSRGDRRGLLRGPAHPLEGGGNHRVIERALVP